MTTFFDDFLALCTSVRKPAHIVDVAPTPSTAKAITDEEASGRHQRS